jgi:ubiquitin carboxyl-terminal hydrolase 4/11/15
MQSLPSPADSPSLKTKELNSQPSSRKRLRSQSMQSDASSSSAKRSLSEDPSSDGVLRSPRVDDPFAEADIDTYMAEQGEADIPDTIQLPTHVTLNGTTSALSPPEKLSSVKKLREQQMKVGEIWYIVARRWYRRWEKACTGEIDKEGSVDENLLGPVDNSFLLDKDGNVTSNLVEGVDAEFVCKELWDLFVTWCVYQIGIRFDNFDRILVLLQVW